ncbi:MAG: alkaline phosphatase family protein [Deltaproteobacteria bacterium]|nr:alkaline phosphatase family protein [Deltaproteobacteria bacterium]
MKQNAKKLLMLGLDAALPDLITRFCEEGQMPHTKRLMDGGLFSRMITTFPPLTAAAWGAITSGAGPGTAAIPSLMVHEPGEALDKWHTSFDRRMLKAETLWEAGARAGRKTVLINWPVTYPLRIEKGIQLAASVNPPFRYFYMPLWDIASSAIFSTRRERCNQVPGRAVEVSLKEASGWSHVPPHSGVPCELSIDIPPTYAKGPTYHALALDSIGAGYDRLLIARSKDGAETVADLKEGERSDWITEEFIDSSGKPRRGRFYFHLIRLRGRDDFRLYQSAVNTAETLTIPAEITQELIEAAGPYMEVDDPWAYMDGWIDLDFYLNQLTQHNDWWLKATIYGLKKAQWDMAFSWVGTIDHVQHVLYGGIDPNCSYYDQETAPEILGHIRRVYAEVDERIGKILHEIDLNETLVCLVSDHGFSSIEQNPYLKHHLARAGLLHFDLDYESREMKIDWSKTKAFPLEPCHAHIFVNLKGRDPDGIVDPGDYRKVQEEVIDALMGMRDPTTGERVVAVAVRKEEAGTLGVFEQQGYDRIGDVLFALRPQYMANPFVYPVAVKYRDGTERSIPNPEGYEPARLHQNFTGVHLALPAIREMHATVIIAGPGVEKNHRAIPMNVIDLAPTLAYLLESPIPKDAEGNVLKDVLKG